MEENRIRAGGLSGVHEPQGGPRNRYRWPPCWVPSTPPFTLEAELVHWNASTPLPCIFMDTESEEILLVSNHVRVFLKEDLSFSRLDVVYGYLWWAGRQFPARPLHHLHLVWCPRTRRIFLKPLPKYLLSHLCWASHVSIDRDLDASAREHDWALAHDAGLIPAEVTWVAWRDFVESLVRSGGMSVNGLVGVHRRFHYGELRINRLDHIYRFIRPSNGRQLLLGYGGLLSPSYSDFFRKHFRWIIVVFAFCTTVLSALQVGLATDILGSSKTLQGVSSWIVLFSLVVLGVTVVVISALHIALFVFFLLKTSAP
ncbi:hypothetical protein C8A03DRAFT_47616 [Achaetomium macrosporum]|uniref:Uncharacterized protein n=1 Tax=Achaetomium macrosporum TaxID=79813 RepID=A0AAN7C270_9PEZI|nr:hypothetical protein C8A03DRAFT_47616 [Achaetomium macrosporum]